jgi:2-C-methyl-D-erythritol 4-phosphate cytidylyltransferase/2-C-methyl-D-erythritol 2,4-cyclodiphosphate synthase
MSATAVIAAAGSGTRFGSDKLSIKLLGKPVLVWTLEAFQKANSIQDIVIVTKDTRIPIVRELCDDFHITKVTHIVAGGETRQDSVYIGVTHSSQPIVAVHDGARPLISPHLIDKAVDEAEKYGAAVVCVPAKDTIKQAENNVVLTTPDRSQLYLAQTPQVFQKELYLNAAVTTTITATDDVALLEQQGVQVRVVLGEEKNIKITTEQDLKTASAILGESPSQIRIGHGYDVHKLAEERKLILCGVEIPFEMGLMGHSDADVCAHALTDAILGALALGDIGKHFPDTDQKYKDINSLLLLEKVIQLISTKGWYLMNADITIAAQRPKLSPYIPEMRENLAGICGISTDCISVKATTEEGLLLSDKGISAQCVCLLGKWRN